MRYLPFKLGMAIALCGAAANAQMVDVQEEQLQVVPHDQALDIYQNTKSLNTAEPETTVPPQIAENAIPTFTAKLRVLDKNTDFLTDYKLGPTGRISHFGIRIKAKRCVPSANGIPNNDAVYLVVTDTETDSTYFEGWMFSRYPGFSAMEHPVYDVRVMSCSLS